MKKYRIYIDEVGNAVGDLIVKVPWPVITDVEEIDGSLWFGSTWGAFRLNELGKYDYYSSQRWIPDNKVKDIEPGPNGSVLILTETGLGQICFESMTLHDKAMQLEEMTRKNFIRYGFSSRGGGMKKRYLLPQFISSKPSRYPSMASLIANSTGLSFL